MGVPGGKAAGTTRGLTGLIYQSVQGVTQWVGKGLDAALVRLQPLLERVEGEAPETPEREAVLAALNGVMGDRLLESRNPLATPMTFRYRGQALDVGNSLTMPQATGKVLLLIHGLCMNDLQWQTGSQEQVVDHGAALESALGYTPVYLRYNTGLHISANGRSFADMLETLVQHWPVPIEELTIVAHSMGGLVSRSAYHAAVSAAYVWPRHLRSLVFLGTPHHGAPLERGGNWLNLLLGVSAYSAAFVRLGQIRSAGITDLRYGNLLEADWSRHDRFAHVGDQRQPVPLPRGVRVYAMAATTGAIPGDLNDQLFGDGLVPVSSALGRHPDARLALALPEDRQWVGYTMNHLDLLDRPEVYAQLRRWLSAPALQLSAPQVGAEE
jgi:hypothetical protein